MRIVEHIRIAFDQRGEPHVTRTPASDDPIVLPGWSCLFCCCWNGEAAARRDQCRHCAAERPQ